MKWVNVFLLAVACSVAGAQTQTITGTAVDSDGQVWQAGSYKVEFYPNSSYPNISQYYVDATTPLSTYTTTFAGPLDITGSFSQGGIINNNRITPVGSQWKFTVCPKATSQCGVFQTPVTADASISGLISSVIKAPRFDALAGTYGYNDGETIINQPNGATYWNVISLCQRYFDGSAWACNGTGGGGGGGGGTNIVLTTNGFNGPTTYDTVSRSLNVPNYQGLIGYTPFRDVGGGLILDVDSGVSFCLGTKNSYSAGTVGVNNNTTNYVYLAPVTCNVTVNQTGYPAAAFPIATVITSGGAITSIIDDRTPFNSFAGGGGGGASTIIQVDGIATTPTSPVNFSSSTPAPPSGYQPVSFHQSISPANISAYIPNFPTNLPVGPGSIQMNPVLPIGGTYDIVYPTGVSVSDPDSTGTTADTRSSKNIYPWHSSGFTNAATVTWTYTLPSWITAGSVSAVYGAFNWSSSKHIPVGGGNDFQLSCGIAASVTISNADMRTAPYPSQDSSALLPAVTGSNFNTSTCTSTMHGCFAPACQGDTGYVNQVYMIVYHTGLTQNSSALNVFWPLVYTSSTNGLSTDPMFPYWMTPISATQLPSTATFLTARSFLVTDATSTADCTTTGGGSHTHWCTAQISGSYTASGETTYTLPTQYTTWSCQPGMGDGTNAITAATYLQTGCKNTSGVTWTITSIQCFSDNNGTSTLALTNGAGTALLTGAVTCTNSFAAGTQSATVTIASGDFLKFTFVADGTSKQSTWVVAGTY